MTNEKTIYDLKLHESLTVEYLDITRVPGGWIYSYRFTVRVVPVFVPFHNEFMKLKEKTACPKCGSDDNVITLYCNKCGEAY